MPPDILDNLTRVADAPPALNATSDMPAIETPTPEPAAAPEPAPAAAPEPVADETAAAPEPPAEPARQRSPGIEGRLSDLARQRREAEARAAAADARLEKALAALERVSAPPVEPPAAPAEEPRPTREAFETPDAYDEALISWSSRRAAVIGAREAQAEWTRQQEAARQAEAERQANEAQQRTQDEVVQSWNQKRAAAIEKHPDFAEVAESDQVAVTMPMRDAILSLDDGTEIAYHLGKNPQEAERIAKLTPVRQVAEIGRIAAQLAAPAPTPPPPPPPITPLRGGANGAGERNIYTNEPSMDDYAATRLAELRGERKAGMLGIPRAN